MWKLFHSLFGWDYIQWRNSCDGGIARVYKDHSGRAFYFRYGFSKYADEISKPNQVFWLTCPPSKYIEMKTMEHPHG